MNTDKIQRILSMVDEDEPTDGLCIVSMALILLAYHYGYTKLETIENFSRQWDVTHAQEIRGDS